MSTPAPKRQRAVDGTPATRTVAHGRIELDVGGSTFVSSRSSLEGASSYFRALFGRWSSDDSEQPIFLDCDADAFQVLLSYIRLPSNVLLPQEPGLATRVLGLAEYLGIDGFLAAVKARAYANMHPDASADDPAAAFDDEAGSLQQAIDRGILPARFFAPAPPPPEPAPERPLRTIKSIIPTSGYHAVFIDDDIEPDASFQEQHHSRRPIIGFAVVELRDGTQCVDAVIQPHEHEHEVAVRRRDAQTRSQLTLASEYALSVPWEHWVVTPPAAPPSLLPIPPGSVRGVWKEPVFTEADEGKAIDIEGGTVTVDGKQHHVEWMGATPHDFQSGRIRTVHVFVKGRVSVQLNAGAGFRSFRNPAAPGDGDELVDLAFASVDTAQGGSTLETKFYMPIATPEAGQNRLTLQDPRKISFGKMQFSHFI